jgi:uncharacterized protein (DUF885 family)
MAKRDINLKLAALVSLSCMTLNHGGLAAEPASVVQTTTSDIPVEEIIKISQEQVAFNKLTDEYFDDAFRSNPVWATDIGVHTYDGDLNGYSEAERNERAAKLKSFLSKFEAIKVDQLDKFSRLDLQMLIAHIKGNLLELEGIQSWKTNPDVYSSHASAAIFALMKRNFAPAEDRLKSVISREKRIPVILNDARANLSNPPKVYTDVALEQMPGIISFFETAVPEAFSTVKDETLQKEFKAENAKVIEALKSYQTFLKTDILPKSKGEFALGKEKYQQKLLYDEMVDEDTDVLLARGWDELHRLQKEFADTARQINPKKTPLQVYADMSANYPKPDQILSSVKGVLSNLKEVCETNGIVTIPSEDELKVEETPPFMRALTFASMDAPGPFETKAKEAYYHVTLPEKHWPAKRTEEHMRFFCKMDILNTSVHEAYPGHYVQGLWMRQAPSKTRKLLYCGSNSEGWAHYCEEMMPQQGLSSGDKELKLMQIHAALLRASRYIAGISMHTKGMSMNEAINLFVKEGYQPRANAEREAKRGTSDPTYLVYTLGKMQILQLRDDYKKAKGNNYSLKDFHNNFLAQGGAPLKIVRQALLGEKGPGESAASADKVEGTKAQ